MLRISLKDAKNSSTFHNDDKGGSGQQIGLDVGFDFEEEGEGKGEGDGKDEGKAGEGKTPSSEEVKKKEGEPVS